MDVNQYMQKSIELLERIAEGVEALTQHGVHVTNFNLPEGTELKAVGQVVHTAPAVVAAVVADKVVEKKPAADKKAAKVVEQKAQVVKEQAAEVPEEEEAAEETVEEVVEEKKETKRKVTADDARKALKAYAAIEGNDAAMELLTSLGAASVSALAEQGDEKLLELVEKCGS